MRDTVAGVVLGARAARPEGCMATGLSASQVRLRSLGQGPWKAQCAAVLGLGVGGYGPGPVVSPVRGSVGLGTGVRVGGHLGVGSGVGPRFVHGWAAQAGGVVVGVGPFVGNGVGGCVHVVDEGLVRGLATHVKELDGSGPSLPMGRRSQRRLSIWAIASSGKVQERSTGSCRLKGVGRRS